MFSLDLMRVTWEKRWPRWVGIACTWFGVANVAGALMAPPGMMLPGVMVGLAWATVGLKGLPRFGATTSAVASPSQRIIQGLRTIRHRRLFAFAGLFLWAVTAVIALPRVPEKLIGTAFFISALPVSAFFVLWALSACPRCEHYFLPVLRLRARVSLRRCQECGLDLHETV